MFIAWVLLKIQVFWDVGSWCCASSSPTLGLLHPEDEGTAIYRNFAVLAQRRGVTLSTLQTSEASERLQLMQRQLRTETR
jgi:hypothetical protein